MRVKVSGAFRLGIDEATPLALLVSELITNSLEHAFPGDVAGTIKIELHVAEGGARELIVADDGVGMTDGTRHGRSSPGLRLVARRAEQLLGSIQRLDAAPGTSFLISIPPTSKKVA